jgi:hypothetical protein
MADEIYINTGSTFQQPYNARTPANAQQPYIANAQQPYPYIANAQQPYIANAQQPYPYIANAQQPYIANAQQPYPYIANAQQPYIANARQPYPYIANAQQPYIANARNPFTYARQAQTPYPYIVNARSPFTYQVPFITQQPYTFNARTPFTYQAQGRVPASAQQPYTFSARRPAVGRIPYIYAGDTSYIGSSGLIIDDWAETSSGGVTSVAGVIIYAYYSSASEIQLKAHIYSAEDTSWYNTSNVLQDPTAGVDLPTNNILYKIEDVASGYTVRYSITGGTTTTGDDYATVTGYSSSPANASMSPIVGSISTTTIRGVLFRHVVTVSDGESASGDTLFDNVSFIFEKSGSTTFTKTFDIFCNASADSYGGQ